MTQPNIMYGLKNEERLYCEEADEVVQRLLDDCAGTGEESFDEVAQRLTWPVKVFEFRRMELGEGYAGSIAQDILERTLDDLDTEYSDPDGDPTEPTQRMKDVALAFGQAVVADYVPWAMVQTGKVIEYTQEMARELDAKAHPPGVA